MLRIAIVDDEDKCINNISVVTENFFNSKKMKFQIFKFRSGEDILSNQITMDLIFLDIMMDGIDGITTAQILREKNKKAALVYVTSFSNKIKHSFSVHPFAFIEKPFSFEQLSRVLQDYLDYKTEDNSEYYVSFYSKQKGKITLSVKSIIFFEYTGNRSIHIHTKDSEMDITGNISDLAANLAVYDFLCPHKSFIINMQYIQKFDKEIILEGGHCIPIAKNRSKLIHELINNYLHSHLLY